MKDIFITMADGNIVDVSTSGRMRVTIADYNKIYTNNVSLKTFYTSNRTIRAIKKMINPGIKCKS